MVIHRMNSTMRRMRSVFRTPHVVAISISVVAVVLSAWLLLRNRPQEYLTREDRAQVQASARTFSSFPRVPASDETSVADAIQTAAVIPGQYFTTAPEPEQRAALARTVARWMRFRADLDAEGYADWMQSRGCSLYLQDPDAVLPYDLRLENRQSMYEYLAKAPMPDNITPREYFLYVYEQQLRAGGAEFLLPREVAIGAGLAVLYRMLNDGPSAGIMIERWDGGELWFGNITGGGEQHWRPPHSLQDVIGAHGSALVATVAIASRSPRGDWSPFGLTLYWDPDAGEWRFEQITISNVLNYEIGAGAY